MSRNGDDAGRTASCRNPMARCSLSPAAASSSLVAMSIFEEYFVTTEWTCETTPTSTDRSVVDPCTMSAEQRWWTSRLRSFEQTDSRSDSPLEFCGKLERAQPAVFCRLRLLAVVRLGESRAQKFRLVALDGTTTRHSRQSGDDLCSAIFGLQWRHFDAWRNG